jgi:hypothetical protein
MIFFPSLRKRKSFFYGYCVSRVMHQSRTTSIQREEFLDTISVLLISSFEEIRTGEIANYNYHIKGLTIETILPSILRLQFFAIAVNAAVATRKIFQLLTFLKIFAETVARFTYAFYDGSYLVVGINL